MTALTKPHIRRANACRSPWLLIRSRKNGAARRHIDLRRVIDSLSSLRATAERTANGF